MHEFHIRLSSFRQVQDFVRIAMSQPFEVMVGNHHQRINGKDFMGMCSLDYNHPLQVSVTCSEEEYSCLYRNVEKYLVHC